jgi:diadenylate cyclase
MNTTIVMTILDVLIVSILVYYFLILLKSTRALQLAIGLTLFILFLYVLSWFSKTVGFHTVNWLLDGAINILTFSLPILVVVLFQPELRRLLGKLGTSESFFGRFTQFLDTNSITEETVNIISEATETLSQKKTGALIVIERESSLDSFEESGVTIDGVISKEMLITLFTPPSLLHDGAIIIKKNTIQAARVILPLTDNLHITRNFGTRHRAGIGITEDTDAIGIIVSEETGRISLSVSGRITSNLTPSELRGMLTVMLKVKKNS